MSEIITVSGSSGTWNGYAIKSPGVYLLRDFPRGDELWVRASVNDANGNAIMVRLRDGLMATMPVETHGYSVDLDVETRPLYTPTPPEPRAMEEAT